MTDPNPSRLLTDPIESITYADVLAFCEQRLEEDIDIDYKSNWPDDLARLLCSFANTQGGLALIGVQEDGKSRQPSCPPVGVEGAPDDLRQRALNASFDEVFPPVSPEVAICTLPADATRHAVVIRVSPSRLMHATDRRTRIYVRSRDSNRGYALASLQDLRWLWDQRQESMALRDTLLNKARERSISPAIAFEDEEARNAWETQPWLEVVILPSHPSPSSIPPLTYVQQALADVNQERCPWPGVDRRVPWRTDRWRLVPGAVALSSRGFTPLVQYIEVGELGHLYFRLITEAEPATSFHRHAADDRPTVRAYAILALLDVSLAFAARLYDTLKRRFHVTLSATLYKVLDTRLHFNFNMSNVLQRTWLSEACPDTEISLLTGEIPSTALHALRPELLQNAATSLVWAYGIPWSPDQVAEALDLVQGPKHP